LVILTDSKPEAHPAFLANQLRRKKIPWTEEEEEMLRVSFFFLPSLLPTSMTSHLISI